MGLKKSLRSVFGRTEREEARPGGPAAGADGRREGGRLRQEARERGELEAKRQAPAGTAGPRGRRRGTRRGAPQRAAAPAAGGGRPENGHGGGYEGGYGADDPPDGYSQGYEYDPGSVHGDAGPAIPAGLGPPERVHSPKRNLAARAMAGFVYFFAFVGLLWFTLAAYQGFFGGSSSAPSATEATGAAARDAEALAEPFAAAYLTTNAGENQSAARARVTPFVSPDLISEVAPAGGGGATRRVLATGTVRSLEEREGRWAVHTESVVETTLAPGAPAGAGASAPADPAAGDAGALGTDPAGDLGGQTVVERIGLTVYVGQDASGGMAVVAPPLMVAPRPAYEGQGGAIYGEDGATLYDGPVKSLLEGYFAAAYGSDESRSSLQNFVVDGGEVPLQPAPGLQFVSLKGGALYPLGEAANPDWSEPYDVAAYVDVTDASTGQTLTQTHLLRVAETEDGWKVVGGEEAVGSGG